MFHLIIGQGTCPMNVCYSKQILRRRVIYITGANIPNNECQRGAMTIIYHIFLRILHQIGG